MSQYRTLNPWYVILWRIPWFVIYQTCIFIAALAIACSGNKDDAVHFWKSNV